MTKIVNGLFAIALLLSAGPSIAQTCSDSGWRDLGDRCEGEFKEKSMISGGSFTLLSVSYRASGIRAGDLHLHFWQPKASVLDELTVHKPLPSASNDKVAYRMDPKVKQFAAGPASFSWPQKLIKQMGLNPDHLHTRIKAGDSYIPGLLSDKAAPAAAGGYVFVFDSGAGIDAGCSIAPIDGDPVVEFDCYQEFGGEVIVEWNGKDDGGQPLPDGQYVLMIEGDMLAEVIRPVETSVNFWHRNSLR